MKIPMVNDSCCTPQVAKKDTEVCCIEDKQSEQIRCCPPKQIVNLNPNSVSENSLEMCCGGPPPPKSNPYERPGYTLCHYVASFVEVNKRDLPLIRTELSLKDNIGTLFTRLGLNREDYKVSPGLYGVGNPKKDSDVIVTANYKLTFDAVRRALKGCNVWLIVLDTCGINVWCAAGKGTFSTAEIVDQLKKSNLSEIVNHRMLIVPQLGATGVSAHMVKKQTGFKVVYGPVRADDLPSFLLSHKCDEAMRRVTFSLKERFELVPVEFYLFSKKIWWIFPIIFLISGVGPWFFSPAIAWSRGLVGSIGVIAAGFTGAMVVPLFLPWIPGRAFFGKGGVGGLFCFLILWFVFGQSLHISEQIGLGLTVIAISSYLSMNFTGSTPFTSPSGVEKEMKIAIPIQVAFVVVGLICWLVAPFLYVESI